MYKIDEGDFIGGAALYEIATAISLIHATGQRELPGRISNRYHVTVGVL